MKNVRLMRCVYDLFMKTGGNTHMTEKLYITKKGEIKT